MTKKQTKARFRLFKIIPDIAFFQIFKEMQCCTQNPSLKARTFQIENLIFNLKWSDLEKTNAHLFLLFLYLLVTVLAEHQLHFPKIHATVIIGMLGTYVFGK